jgi:peptide/nickel transport system substrate-binding protein
MVKRFFVLVAVLLIASLVLAACSSSPTTSSPPATTTPPATTLAPATSAPVTTIPPASAPTTSAVIKPTTSAPVSPVPSASPTGTQQYGGVLRIINTGSPLSLGDTTLLQDSASIMACIPAIETLVNSDNAGQFYGVLATEWTIAPDGKSITFKLRKGVKFHDGTDFNAQAAKWNMDRYYEVFKTTSGINQWNGIEILDDYTIKLNLKSFLNTLLNGLDGSAGMMVSPTAFQKNGADWAKLNPVGTGPYMLKSFSRDVSVEYVRFDGYWRGKPFLDGIRFLTVVDPTTARLLFQSGGADVVSVSSDAITNDLIKAGFVLEKRPGPMMNLIPDSKHATSPFADIKVRQAISYAIDRKGIANTLGYGLWEVVNQPAAAYQFGHIDNVPYTYDVAKAKQLIKESGYPNGFKTSIIASTSFSRDPLVAIQAQLAAIGITAELRMVEMAAWNEFVNKGWDNSLLWATQGATQTNYVSFLSLYYAGNATRYPVLAKPAGLDDLINKALATADYETEKALCQQAVKLLVDDCTAIPVYITPASYILTTKVHDTRFDALAGAGFRWSVPTAWLSK